MFLLFQLAFTCRKVTDEEAWGRDLAGRVSSQGSSEGTKTTQGVLAEDFNKLANLCAKAGLQHRKFTPLLSWKPTYVNPIFSVIVCHKNISRQGMNTLPLSHGFIWWYGFIPLCPPVLLQSILIRDASKMARKGTHALPNRSFNFIAPSLLLHDGHTGIANLARLLREAMDKKRRPKSSVGMSCSRNRIYGHIFPSI